MKRRKLVVMIEALIGGVYSPQEARSVAYAVTERFFGFGRTQVVVEPDAVVDEYDPLLLEDVCRQLAASRPLQYVIGVAEFCGLTFRVCEGVLIPRPETEELVRWIAVDMKSDASPAILDIGTGSGAIAVALALIVSGSVVDAVDISPDALGIARYNACSLGANVRFIEGDVLQGMDVFAGTLPRDAYDVVVSNPPYIPASEYETMDDNVRKYEPSMSLFVEDADPLLFYREIGVKASVLLKPSGRLYFEIHEKFADMVCGLLVSQGYTDVECRDDINGRPRMVRAVKV